MQCLVLQHRVGIKSCQLPVRCLVKAGTGLLNATFTRGDLSFYSENMTPAHADVLAELFNTIQTHSDLAASFVQLGENLHNSISEVVF